MSKLKLGGVLSILFLIGAPAARAQWAVVDVGAIAQLIQQVATMEEQLSTAKDQLSEAKDTLESMRGDRGMSHLLSGENRNYLPTNWSELEAALRGTAGAYGALSNALTTLIQSNAVLKPSDIARLSPTERAHLTAERGNAALLQATARQALAVTSERFASLQSLIAAISGAQDQKAILDLQARIAAEQGMLANEHAKLDTLYQVAQGERWAQEQRAREQAITDIGSFRSLPPLGL
jgi:type IV secretion system protein VirB5